MERIDKWTTTATQDGLFTEGDPMVPTPATILKDDFLNMVQEELVNAVEGAGLTLDAENDTQLLAAITAIAAAAQSAATVPPGVTSQYGGDTAPTGYLLCTGAAVSRTTYAALYAIIGTKFGNGNGSTTFNLPDMRRRMPLGKDGATNIGDTGGDETKDLSHAHATQGHALTEAEMPTHEHKIGSTTRTHWSGSVTSQPQHIAAPGTGIPYDTTPVGSGQAHEHGDTDPDGSETQDILPPYVVTNFIIKT